MTDAMENCGFMTALRAIEGKWKVDILCELGKAARRFGRLRQAMPAISEKMLAQQLRELEADGLVSRTIYAETPPKVVYSLTKRGAALNIAAEGLCKWGEMFGRNAAAGEGGSGDLRRGASSPEVASAAARSERVAATIAEPHHASGAARWASGPVAPPAGFRRATRRS
ncbi:winged helix-turn-helix transcriptional regulator [Ensifer sp. NPDC090286]|uniref:winged helix-turn-helix transcriptional regulator n=1 Tax=Ensifer sp. NPDC090286 TaxID=3363991 RepID=UPI00383B5082